MSKKHKKDAPPKDSTDAAPKVTTKARVKALEVRLETLEGQMADLSRVVDEAIRATINVRQKASEVRPRRRPSAPTESGSV